VHARVHVDTELEAMTQLLQFARSQDVDGVVITPATGVGELSSPTVENGGSEKAHWEQVVGSVFQPAC